MQAFYCVASRRHEVLFEYFFLFGKIKRVHRAVVPTAATRNSVPAAPPAKGKKSTNLPAPSAKSPGMNSRPSPTKVVPQAPAKKANAGSSVRRSRRGRPTRNARLAAKNGNLASGESSKQASVDEEQSGDEQPDDEQPDGEQSERSIRASGESSKQASVDEEQSGDEQSDDEQPDGEQSERSIRASGESSKQASGDEVQSAEQPGHASTGNNDNQLEDNSPPGAAKGSMSSSPDATQVIAPQDSSDPEATQVIVRTNARTISSQGEADPSPQSADPTVMPEQNTDKEIEAKQDEVEEEIVSLQIQMFIPSSDQVIRNSKLQTLISRRTKACCRTRYDK